MSRLGELMVAVECSNCGTHGEGVPLDGENSNRCTKCGRFAEGAENYCIEHDVDETNLPAGYTECPYCAERRRVEQQRQEMMARRADPTMHPTVDAPRR